LKYAEQAQRVGNQLVVADSHKPSKRGEAEAPPLASPRDD
jgi:hypothetical protein